MSTGEPPIGIITPRRLKCVAIALLALLAGCHTGPTDGFGLSIPAVCVDVSDQPAEVRYEDGPTMDARYAERNPATRSKHIKVGGWAIWEDGKPVALVRKGLSNDMVAKVVEHEKCHLKARRLGTPWSHSLDF